MLNFSWLPRRTCWILPGATSLSALHRWLQPALYLPLIASNTLPHLITGTNGRSAVFTFSKHYAHWPAASGKTGTAHQHSDKERKDFFHFDCSSEKGGARLPLT